MAYGDKHPCPNCGKEHDEGELLSKCTKCGQIYCGDYNCGQGGCPRCGNGGAVYVTWNPIERKWC